MFFAAHLGDEASRLDWLRTTDRHAAWLGLTAQMESRPLDDGRTFTFGWLSIEPTERAAAVREMHDRLTVATLEAEFPPDDDLDSLTGFEPGVSLLQVDLKTGRVVAWVPPAAVEKFFSAPGPRGSAWSNDLRLLLRWAGIELHETGVYSLFQEETTAWTLTLSRTVQQIPLGHRWTLPAGGGPPTLEACFRWPQTGLNSGSLLETARAILDRAVAQAGPGSAVAFSGDTDSALVAARLASQDRHDVTLIHFATDAGHPRAERARRMAAHMGMPFELVAWRPQETVPLLGRLAREYAFPFGDMAVLSTLMLVDAAAAHEPRPPRLLDGSGPEILNPGTWHYQKWQRIYRIPRFLRAAIGTTFELGLWKSESDVARFADSMRTSLRMPLSRIDYYGPTYGTGIGYTVPRAVRQELESIAEARLDVLQAGLSERHRASISRMKGLGLTVARSFDPLRVRGIRPLYPFLRPQLLRLCAGLAYEDMNPKGEAKGLWKAILAENVPRKWIDQPREGFPMPYEDAFRDPGAVAFLNDVVLAPSNPLMDYCHPKRVREIANRIQNRKPASGGLRRFLWTLTFASAWLAQLSSELRTRD